MSHARRAAAVTLVLACLALTGCATVVEADPPTASPTPSATPSGVTLTPADYSAALEQATGVLASSFGWYPRLTSVAVGATGAASVMTDLDPADPAAKPTATDMCGAASTMYAPVVVHAANGALLAGC